MRCLVFNKLGLQKNHEWRWWHRFYHGHQMVDQESAKRGVEDMKAGRGKPWLEVKRDLGL